MEEKRIDQYTAKGFEGAENDEQYLLVVKNLKKWFPIKSSFFKDFIIHRCLYVFHKSIYYCSRNMVLLITEICSHWSFCKDIYNIIV